MIASVAAPARAPPTPPATLLTIVEAAVLEPTTAAVVAATVAAFDAAAATPATIAEIVIPNIPPYTDWSILFTLSTCEGVMLLFSSFKMSAKEGQDSI